jgi:hypothetical protein
VSDRPRCTATTKKGAPCPHYTLVGKDVCCAHDRDMQVAAGKRGALAKLAAESERAHIVALASAEQMRVALERALARVEASRADEVRKGNAVARLVTAAISVKSHLDLEQQVRDLCARVEKRFPARAN